MHAVVSAARQDLRWIQMAWARRASLPGPVVACRGTTRSVESSGK